MEGRQLDLSISPRFSDRFPSPSGHPRPIGKNRYVPAPRRSLLLWRALRRAAHRAARRLPDSGQASHPTHRFRQPLARSLRLLRSRLHRPLPLCRSVPRHLMKHRLPAFACSPLPRRCPSLHRLSLSPLRRPDEPLSLQLRQKLLLRRFRCLPQPRLRKRLVRKQRLHPLFPFHRYPRPRLLQLPCRPSPPLAPRSLEPSRPARDPAAAEARMRSSRPRPSRAPKRPFSGSAMAIHISPQACSSLPSGIDS